MAGWLARLGIGSRAERGAERWVVVDVETSGMDARRDGLISIGAVAMRSDGRVLPADSLEIVVRQASASARDNILIHGIGVHAQLNGADPVQAATAFLDYVGTAPIVAYHAPFDRGFLARAIKVYVNQPFDNPWLDLAELAPVLEPGTQCKALDDWLRRYGIPVSARHSAAADAFATALLAARLLPSARRQGGDSFRALQKICSESKWLAS